MPATGQRRCRPSENFMNAPPSPKATDAATMIPTVMGAPARCR